MYLTRKAAISLTGALTVITSFATAQPTSFSALFKAPVSFPAGLRPYDVKAGDFNGDGRPDVAVVNRGLNGSGGAVSVYLANSTGQLVKVRTDLTALLLEPTSLAVGDLNGDGRTDLVIGDFGLGGVISFVAQSTSPVFLDATAIFSPADTGTASVDLGFLDAGTVLDAATVNRTAGTVSRLNGDGLGGFAMPVNTDTIGIPRFIRIGNLDGFGVNDAMVVSNDISVATFTTRLHFSNSTNGILNDVDIINIRSGGSNTQGALGDIDGDGDTDVAVASFNAVPGNAGGKITLFRNDTLFENNPVFTEIAAVPVGSSPYSVALGDVDGDGDQDLCVTYRNSSADDITIILNDGSGTFSTQLKFAFSATDSPRSIALVDIDMDGDLDLLTTRKPDTDTVGNNGKLLIFENLTIPNADLNGDGVVDAADLSILLGQWGCSLPATCTADLNGSGTVDAVDLAFPLSN